MICIWSAAYTKLFIHSFYKKNHNMAIKKLKEKYWISSVPLKDDFGDEIKNEFIDGKSSQGPWGLFTPKSYERHGAYPGKFGAGIAHKYSKQENGRWLKIA